MPQEFESSIPHDSIDTRYPFAGKKLQVNGQLLHYVEQGTGQPVVFLHGNPTWSYTWRNIIPALSDSARCIAVDLIGMGRSDKPEIGYTFAEHVDYITRFIGQLGLRDVVLVGHDWGVAIGLQYAFQHPENVRGICMIEPQALAPCEDWGDFSPPEAVELFQTLRDPEQGWPFMRDNSVFIEGMTRSVTSRPITVEEQDYYREPFINPDNRKPMWVFPNQIPVGGEPREVVQAVDARNEWFTRSAMPKLLLYATPGCNVREPQIDWCSSHLANLTTAYVGEGYHYLTEENPRGIGTELRRWLAALE